MPDDTEKPDNSPLIQSPGSIFELVDNTSDETYFPMGLFVTLEAALDAIRDKEEPPTDDPEEFVRLEVRERKVGKLTWWDNGKTVATIEWFADYSEQLDEWIWAGPKIDLSNIEVAGCEPATQAQHNRANSHSAH